MSEEKELFNIISLGKKFPTHSVLYWLLLFLLSSLTFAILYDFIYLPIALVVLGISLQMVLSHAERGGNESKNTTGVPVNCETF